MYTHSPVEPEVLDLLVREINARLSKIGNVPAAAVEEYHRGTPEWSWAFLWQGKLKVAGVRMFANRRAVRINFLFLGETIASKNWVKMLYHENEPAWNNAIRFMGDLGQYEYWSVTIKALAKKQAELAAEPRVYRLAS